MSRYRDDFFNRVLAPEGEILSFAPPRQLLCLQTTLRWHCSTSCILAVEKKVSKEKAARLPLDPALLGFVGGRQSGLLPLCPWVHLPTRGIPAAPLYALWVFGLIPTKPAMLGAANGGKATLLRNVSY
ncbi:hypothetical protein CEK71_11440 [Methylovulum psychrotolerans]|uniref:Uncharacterized protein n=1 Tax=Methylovulum psychrotolerans TaxID=1704499 RepID=A0A1Z4BZC4_9GAMM|nr:hypothetical protein CEK71_11440 [Methylovulum psychrotolerans]